MRSNRRRPWLFEFEAIAHLLNVIRALESKRQRPYLSRIQREAPCHPSQTSEVLHKYPEYFNRWPISEDGRRRWFTADTRRFLQDKEAGKFDSLAIRAKRLKP